MRIVFTGGGSGGHFYPIIAITEAIRDLVREEHLIDPELYYLAPMPFDEQALFENGIGFIKIRAGKVRRYTSLRNLTDVFATLSGTLHAVSTLFRLYPDVVVSKGGYASVPTVLAARLLRIPIVIHESDAKPGRANLLAAPFAKKIAISFESAAKLFPPKVQSRIARTGIPIRKALLHAEAEGAVQFLQLETGVPTVFIIGGSLGSARINEAILSALPDLVAFSNVIHQTGPAHIESVESLAKVILVKSEHANRYHPFGYLTEVAMQRAAGAASIIVSRAGATSISEISLWHKPAILIPIPESVSHDQKTNAYAFARTGAATVIEEENLTPHLLVSEIHRILLSPDIARKMAAASAGFTDPDAARILAREVLGIALSHES